MTSAAIFTLWADDPASIFRRRFAMCLACLMQPSSLARRSCPGGTDCDPGRLLLVLGVMNNRLTSSSSNSCRHSGHVEKSLINFSTHEEQFVSYTEWHRVNATKLTANPSWSSPQGRERMCSNLNEFMHIGQFRSYMCKSNLSRESNRADASRVEYDHVSWFDACVKCVIA